MNARRPAVADPMHERHPRHPGLLARARGLVALALVAVALAGCSALRMGYGQADTFAYIWLDRYVDFDATQGKAARNAIAAWFAWHRRTQLPDYAELLMRAESEVMADTTAERACAWWATVRIRLDRAVEQAVPPFAEIATTLTPAQLEHIEKRYAKTNKEFRDEFLQPDLGARQAATVKRTVDRYESMYGDLENFQKERLERLLSESPWDPARSYDERRARQRDALQALTRLSRNKTDAATARGLVRDSVQRFFISSSPAYREYAERVTRHNCQIFAELHNSMSPEQRQHASQKLRAYAMDLRALAAERAD
jgi:hypothetical protein